MLIDERCTADTSPLRGKGRVTSALYSLQFALTLADSDGRNEHMHSPIRQTQTEKCRYIYKEIQLSITKHIDVKLAQQITNSFMQWNKNSLHTVITVKKL